MQAKILGNVTWQDADGQFHPARGILVELLPNGEISPDSREENIKTTDAEGNYEFDVEIDKPYKIRAYAAGDQHTITESDGEIYSIDSEELIISDDTDPILLNFTSIQNNTPESEAFSVTDALYTAELFSDKVFQGSDKITVVLSETNSRTAYAEGVIYLQPGYANSWDVIHHEYGHFIADSFALDGLPDHDFDKNHSPLESSIFSGSPPRNKLEGIALAWSEGLATYLALAAQDITAESRNSLIQGKFNYDSRYLSDPTDTARNYSLDLETSSISNLGEGHEIAVARALWDIADDNNEPHDQISLGHEGLIKILASGLSTKLPGVVTLNDLWTYFRNQYEASDPAELIKYGAIFEEYSIAPRPQAIQESLLDSSLPPTFQWEPGNQGNGNANDEFKVYVFNSNFSDHLESSLLNGQLEWTPDTSSWQPFINQSEINGLDSIFHLVVAGSDQKNAQDNPLSVSEQTGPYWSGSRSFEVNSADDSDQPSGPILTRNLGLLASSIRPLLQSIKQAVASQVLDQLPILGGLSLAPFAEEFISNELEQRVFDELNALENATVEDIQQALFGALGPNGFNLLLDLDEDGQVQLDDIQISQDASSIEFVFELGKVIRQTLEQETKLGFPAFNLAFDGGISSEIDLSTTISFGVDNSNFINGTPNPDAFFINTALNNEIQAKISADFSDEANNSSSFEGSLGFFKVAFEDRGSNLTGQFSADLTSSVADEKGRIRLSDLDQGLTTNDPSLSASANLKLFVDTALLNGIMPSIDTELNLLGWEYNSDSSASLVLPDVEFKNLTLDLGSFIERLVGNIFEQINKVTDPLDPIIERLNKDLPVIKASLIELAQKAAKSGLISGYFDKSTFEFIEQLANIISIIETIDDLANSAGDIDLGDFTISPEGGFEQTRESSFPNLLAIEPTAEANSPVLTDGLKSTSANPSALTLAPTNILDGSDSDLSGLLGDDSPFDFPILEDPFSILGLLLGQETPELFTYETPKLNFGFDLNGLAPIPVFGPIVLSFGGGAGVGAQLKFGFDTVGLKAYRDSGFSNPEQLLDGFFVSRPGPFNQEGIPEGNNLSLFGELTAAAAVNLGIAEVAAGGGVRLTLGLDAANRSLPETDLEHYKVRGSTIASVPPLCILDPNGVLSAIIFASFKIGFGFFSITKRFDLANINIIDFSLGSGGCDSDQPHYDVEDPEPDPEVEAQLAGQGIISRKGTDGDDVITLEATEVYIVDDPKRNDQNAAINAGENILTGLDEEPKAYKDVQLVVIKAGAGDDRIEFIDSEENGEFFGTLTSDIIASGQLEGGSGNDVIIGGMGIDFLNGGEGADTLDGMGGENTAVYASDPEGVVVDLATGVATDGYGNIDTLLNIRNVEATSKRDILIAHPEGSILDAGDGDDDLFGGIGDDVMLSGAGADFVDGADGIDTITYLGSKAAVYVNLSGEDVFIISPADGAVSFLAANTGFGGNAEGDRVFNVENVQGSIFDDTLVAADISDGDINIDGLSGNDLIIAGAAAQIMNGNQGNDWITYSRSTEGVDVSLRRGNGQGNGYDKGDKLAFAVDEEGEEIKNISSFENLEGSDWKDFLEGDNQSNIIRGRSGEDEIRALSGNDILIGGAGGDRHDGGDGADWADYSESPNFVSVNLATAIGANGDADGDTFVQTNGVSTVENLRGSGYGDLLTGDNGNNIIDPGLSSAVVPETGSRQIDQVNGGFGEEDLLIVNYSINDFGTGATGGFQDIVPLLGGSGLITRNSNANNSTLDGVQFSGIERLRFIGTIQADEITGGFGADELFGSDGNDRLDGAGGQDTIRGDDGDDLLIGGSGADDIDGGSGFDTVSYITAQPGSSFPILESVQSIKLAALAVQPSQQGVSVDLRQSTQGILGTIDDASGDSLISIEAVQGSLFDDSLKGNSDSNQLSGEDGDDTLIGFEGADNLFGGLGIDSTTYIDSPDGVNISLLENIEGIGGHAEGDILKDIENLTGSQFDDVLEGNESNNRLEGLRGSDTLRGGAGDDILFGTTSDNNNPEDEVDILTGGSGADQFWLGNNLIPRDNLPPLPGDFYDDNDPLTTGGKNYAVITDFNPLEGDTIHLFSAGVFEGPLRPDYVLEASPDDLPTGTAIYRKGSSTSANELIAIVENVSLTSFDAFQFSYVYSILG